MAKCPSDARLLAGMKRGSTSECEGTCLSSVAGGDANGLLNMSLPSAIVSGRSSTIFWNR